nr:hypothetical protein BaRGS_014596 [Batillaria attramentaria]
MVVISQLNFGNYLNKPTYAAAVSQLPRPSVGGNPNEVEDFSKTVLSRVKRAAEQLSKARTVLSHLVSDLVHVPVNITLTLLMPYITSEQLREALDTDSQVKKDLCDCFGVATPSSDDVDPVKLCLCQDQLSPSSAPWDISDNVMRELQKWWHKCVKVKWTKWLREERGGSDLTEDERRDLYEHLLSRFDRHKNGDNNVDDAVDELAQKARDAQLIWINPTDDDDDDDEEDDGADADDQGNDKETSAQNTNEGERENGGSEAEDDDQNSLNSVVRKLVNDEDGELKKMDKKDGDDADPQDNSDNDRDDYADDAQRGQ